MFLILLVNVIVAATGFLLTKKVVPKLSTRIFLWSAIVVLFVIVELIFMSDTFNGFYSKHSYP